MKPKKKAPPRAGKAGATGTPSGHLKKAEVVAAIRETGNKRLACVAAGIGRSTLYKWIEEDGAFAKQIDDAMQEAADLLEEEARRRAHDGVDEPVFYKGAVCGAVRKYSDTLLIFLLKGARPEKYRERHEHSGPGGGAILWQPVLGEKEVA